MTNPDLTTIAMVIDRSGSMASIKSEAENAVNAFIKEQTKLPGKCNIMLSQFDNEYDVVQKSRSAVKFPKYKLEPRGMTALYDAIHKTVDDLGAELALLTENERPGKVLVVVVTDGFENASERRDPELVKAKIQHQTDVYGWQFVFLAAGQDAIVTGGQMGFSAESTLSFNATPVALAATMDSFTEYTANYRTYGKAAFTEEDRESALQD